MIKYSEEDLKELNQMISKAEELVRKLKGIKRLCLDGNVSKERAKQILKSTLGISI